MPDHVLVGTKLHAQYWDGESYPAEIVAISESKRRVSAPFKVHYLGYGNDSDAWLPAAQLKSKSLPKAESTHTRAVDIVKQLALLERGTKLQAQSTDGVWYAAVVAAVSAKRKPVVKVNYLGYTADSDEWVGIDRIRSKLLQSTTSTKTKRIATKKSTTFEDAKLEVPVKQAGKQVCLVSVSQSTLVGEVKMQIFDKAGIAVARQVLVVDPVALMDDEAPLGDMSAAACIELVEVHESGESVMSRLENLLKRLVDDGKMCYSNNKGEITFFNLDILEGDSAEYTVMFAPSSSETNGPDIAKFTPKASLDESDIVAWFPDHDVNGFPDFTLDALQVLNEHGADGHGCFTFSKPDPWGLDGFVVGVGVVISSGSVVGWEQNGITLT